MGIAIGIHRNLDKRWIRKCLNKPLEKFIEKIHTKIANFNENVDLMDFSRKPREKKFDNFFKRNS